MRAYEFITELKFFGSPCKGSCDGHRAGYNWEKKKRKGMRTNGNSNSFGNGTEIAANQASQGVNTISGGITNAQGQFQAFQPGRTNESTKTPRKYMELFVESDTRSKVIHDDIGGRIVISPDPESCQNLTVFSINYINEEMAKFYGVKDRILGYDTHGHQGLKVADPHLHILQKSKKKGHLNSPVILGYEQAYNMFATIQEAIIRDYEAKMKQLNIPEGKFSSQIDLPNITKAPTKMTLSDFNGSKVRYENYLNITRMFREYEQRIVKNGEQD